MAKRILAFVMVLSLLMLCGCQPNDHTTATTQPTETKPVAQNNYYENPIYPLVNGEKKLTYQADPYIVRDDDGTFYMYCTQTDVYTPSLGFKRGPIWKSVDMHSWEYVGDVFADYTPNWGTHGAGVWAPTVAKIGDQWCFYYSLSVGNDTNPGIGLATAPTPYGPWTHHGKLFNSEEIGVTNAIDPHVFLDEENVYMVFGSFGGLITLIELTEDGMGLKGGLEYQKENKVALGGFEVFNLDNYEGSLIIKRDGWYYLLLSTGSFDGGATATYHVVAARSQSLTGPYLDSNGKDLFGPKRGDPVVVPSTSGAMGTGHCSVIMDDAGEYWMLYHGYDTKGLNPNSRVLYLDKLLWDEETGMPYVDTLKASNHVQLPGPYIESLEE